jgi:hypothetical protein
VLKINILEIPKIPRVVSSKKFYRLAIVFLTTASGRGGSAAVVYNFKMAATRRLQKVGFIFINIFSRKYVVHDYVTYSSIIFKHQAFYFSLSIVRKTIGNRKFWLSKLAALVRIHRPPVFAGCVF